MTNVNGLKAHYDLDKLKTGGKIERLREWNIKANFVHKLGKTVAKGPSSDLAKRWHKVEADIREFMFDVLQKDWCTPYFAEVAASEATMST